MLLTVFLLYLIGSAIAVKQDVEYFAGRSANIVIQSNEAAGKSAVLLYGEQFNNNHLKSIEDVNVADLLAHVMGTQPFNTFASRKDFPKGNMFNKAKAALLITLDSVSPDALVTDDFQRVDLTTSSYPTNPFSMAASIASGSAPSAHGIVGEQWMTSNGDRVNAFQGADGASLSANLADILTQEWSGASLTVSASASRSLAAAFAVNKRNAGANSYSIVASNGAFVNMFSKTAGPLALNDVIYEGILENPSFSHLLGGARYSAKKVYVTNPVTVSFDLESEVYAPLFAELAVLFNLVEVLQSDASFASLVADEIPDFFAFSFTGLRNILERHGEKSPEFSAAIVMVNNVIKFAVDQMDRIYGGRAVSVVASLNTKTVTSAAAKAAALSVARTYVNEADFELFYPSIYASTADASKLCGELKSNMDQSATVSCFAPTYYSMAGVYVSLGNKSSNSTKAPLNVPAFWIILWISIVMFLFVLGGIYLLMAAGTAAATDSLLFRSTGRNMHQS